MSATIYLSLVSSFFWETGIQNLPEVSISFSIDQYYQELLEVVVESTQRMLKTSLGWLVFTDVRVKKNSVNKSSFTDMVTQALGIF